MKTAPLSVAAALLVTFSLPARSQDEDPCSRVACSGHGNCLVVDEVPRCACFEGYGADESGLNCVPLAALMPPEPAPPPAGGEVSAWQYREQRRLELMDQGYITKRRYVGAGFLGTFIGLGLGHVAVHEWTSVGWIITVGEVVLGGLALGLLAAAYYEDMPGRDLHWFNASYAFAIMVALVKGWEILDIWIRPHHKIITPEMLFQGSEPAG